MASERIICLRHGEEPDAQLPLEGSGLDARGRPSSSSLTAKGWQRARALAATMLCGTLPAEDVPRTRLFVPNYHGEFDRHRSGETLLPLSLRLRLNIEHPFEKDEPGKLAETLLEASGVAVVCWQHENLEKAVQVLADDDGLKWPRGRYDFIWVLERATADGAYAVARVDQKLLPSDTGAERTPHD